MNNLYGPMDPTLMTAPATPAPAPSNNSNGASDYPAYPNSYNLGSPIDGGAQDKKEIAVPSDSSHGFSPWSQIGESNAR